MIWPIVFLASATCLSFALMVWAVAWFEVKTNAQNEARTHARHLERILRKEHTP